VEGEWKMGYILPVRNYEQEQYSIRDIHSKEKIYKKEEVHPIAKINLPNDIQNSFRNSLPAKKGLERQQMHESLTGKEKLIAKLTGKGIYFHASV